MPHKFMFGRAKSSPAGGEVNSYASRQETGKQEFFSRKGAKPQRKAPSFLAGLSLRLCPLREKTLVDVLRC
jgi:hypothetical protein